MYTIAVRDRRDANSISTLSPLQTDVTRQISLHKEVINLTSLINAVYVKRNAHTCVGLYASDNICVIDDTQTYLHLLYIQTRKLDKIFKILFTSFESLQYFFLHKELRMLKKKHLDFIKIIQKKI